MQPMDDGRIGATAYQTAEPPLSAIDKELKAIATIHSALAGLEPTARLRALRYVSEVMGETG